jgi:hypothetical protein
VPIPSLSRPHFRNLKDPKREKKKNLHFRSIQNHASIIFPKPISLADKDFVCFDIKVFCKTFFSFSGVWWWSTVKHFLSIVKHSLVFCKMVYIFEGVKHFPSNTSIFKPLSQRTLNTTTNPKHQPLVPHPLQKIYANQMAEIFSRKHF